jgi:hypothetical protein
VLPSRKQLKGAAGSLLGTFCSRNNDLDGYWGVGVIYDEANVDAVEIDLLAGTSKPPMRCAATLCERYRLYFSRVLKAYGLADSDVTGVKISLFFNQATVVASSPPPFRGLVAVTDDRGRVRYAETVGRCRRHDPSREMRSVRREPYPYFGSA